MEYKKLTYRTMLGAMLLLPMLAACTGSEVPVPEPQPEAKDMHIRWNVQSEEMADGRALIDDDAALQKACSLGGGNKAIGIWSAYEWDGEAIEHVLGATNDVSLIYEQNTSWDNWEGWTYGEKAVFWKNGAIYYFNAYFPKESGLTGITNTKTAIQGNYDTETTQTDLLVTRTVVDTSADTFQGSPVELLMKHALATLKFIFQMDGGDATNVLESFSLDKTLKTAASLNYDTKVNWTNGTTSANERTYIWSHNGGLPFSATTTASPYTKVMGLYNNNGGHILIIPQSCTVAPTFSCVLDGISFENISLGTTRFEPGKNYIYTIKMKESKIDVTLSIKAWNQLDSSYDITF